MDAKKVVAAWRGSNDAEKRAAVEAATAGKVTRLDTATVEAALAFVGDRDVRVASSAAWMALHAVRGGVAIGEAAFAKALRAALWPDGLLRAAYEVGKKGPLPVAVFSAIPWTPSGGDARRMAARALTAHAIATDDSALADRLLAEKHREFRAGVHKVALEYPTLNAACKRILEHAAKYGDYREAAGTRLGVETPKRGSRRR